MSYSTHTKYNSISYLEERSQISRILDHLDASVLFLTMTKIILVSSLQEVIKVSLLDTH